MAVTKWQCTQCGTTASTLGTRPASGGFCGKSNDHKHKWVRAAVKTTKWQCRECGITQTTGGTRPSPGSFCGKAKDHKHKWSKV